MQGVQQYQPQLFYYFEMDSLIPKNHMLQKIDQLVDMRFVRDLTKPYYEDINGVTRDVFTLKVLKKKNDKNSVKVLFVKRY